MMSFLVVVIVIMMANLVVDDDSSFVAAFSYGRHDTRGAVNLHRPSRTAALSPTLRQATTAATERCGETPTLRGLFTSPPVYNETDEATRDADFVTEVTSGTLETEDGSPHVLNYEVHSRRPNSDGATTRGLTALFLHGGPGAACNPGHVRFFDPTLYQHVVLLDQRGCGKSIPKGETKCNRIELLVEDIERLRLHLFQGSHDPYDVILGGSWGCTLAMAYAHAHPQRVRAMVLRGVCMFRPQEIDWLFGDPPTAVASEASNRQTANLRDLLNDGNVRRPAATTTKDKEERQSTNTASQLFPEEWNGFVGGSRSRQIALNPPTSTNNPRSALQGYYHQLMGGDSLMRIQALKSWMKWEMGIYSRGLSHKTDSMKSGGETQLLVFNPHTQSWNYEDAGDPSNSTPVDKDIAQSLRRFSKASNARQRLKQNQPLTIQQMRLSNQEREDISRSHRQSGFAPEQYVPAQAMLTCHYSTNDDFVMNGYRTFMSLDPPDGLSIDSWYSSKLPPASGHADESIPIADDETVYPLPPTIAIQGGRDGICPPDTSLDLHALWPQLELRIAMNSGHSMYDKVISGEIVKALDRFAQGL